ncbi:MAG: DUF2975 domain-containing protein [Paludibacter sp.]|nr:DUF2975 domain-containing protein [Paludibacter sp.]
MYAKHIRKIEISLIVLFSITLFSNIFSTVDAQNLIQLADYNIVFRMPMGDYMPLFFGVVSLLFAEILKISTQMKEDIELTV